MLHSPHWLVAMVHRATAVEAGSLVLHLSQLVLWHFHCALACPSLRAFLEDCVRAGPGSRVDRLCGQLNRAGSSRRGYWVLFSCCDGLRCCTCSIIHGLLHTHIRRQIASRHALFTCFHFLLPPSLPPLLAWIHAPSPPSSPSMIFHHLRCDSHGDQLPFVHLAGFLLFWMCMEFLVEMCIWSCCTCAALRIKPSGRQHSTCARVGSYQ